MMDETPLFASFLKLKHSNPQAYYSASTHKEMIKLQKQLGAEFFRLPAKERYKL